MYRKIGILTVFRASNNYSDYRMSKALNRFSMVEADSAWQLLKALESEHNPSYRMKLLLNALEEVHHAFLFKSAADQIAKTSVEDVALTRTQLYSSNEDGLKFKISHYLGEKNVFEQFLSYANSIDNKEIKELFLEIRGDEEEHQKAAYLYLKQEVGSPFRLRFLILKEQAVIFYNDLIMLSKTIGDFMSGILISIIYLIGGIFFFVFYKRVLDHQNKKKYLDL